MSQFDPEANLLVAISVCRSPSVLPIVSRASNRPNEQSFGRELDGLWDYFASLTRHPPLTSRRRRWLVTELTLLYQLANVSFYPSWRNSHQQWQHTRDVNKTRAPRPLRCSNNDIGNPPRIRDGLERLHGTADIVPSMLKERRVGRTRASRCRRGSPDSRSLLGEYTRSGRGSRTCWPRRHSNRAARHRRRPRTH